MIDNKHPLAKIYTSKDYKVMLKCLKEKCEADQELLNKHDELDKMLSAKTPKTSKSSKSEDAAIKAEFKKSEAMLDIIAEIIKLTDKQKLLECKYTRCQSQLIKLNRAKSKELLKKLEQSKKVFAMLGNMANKSSKNNQKPKRGAKTAKTAKTTRKTKSAKN